MTIHIIDESPDIYLTQSEYSRLIAEYQQTFMFYSGTPPTFESWVRQKRGDVKASFQHMREEIAKVDSG